MKKNIFTKGLLFFGGLFIAGSVAVSSPVYADKSIKKPGVYEPVLEERDFNTKQTTKNAFAKNKISFQTMLGYLSSSACDIGPSTPNLEYISINLRLGKMINSPSKPKLFPRGNLEALIELSCSGICNGFGNYFVGSTFLLRYNIVQPDWKIIPYAQVGVGVVYTDAYKDSSQNAIGQSIEFTPQVSLGARYLINKKLSIDAEFMFHHISNAGLDERNVGINSFGGLIGFTRNF